VKNEFANVPAYNGRVKENVDKKKAREGPLSLRLVAPRYLNE
jgi:hypothetical protein